MLLSEWERRLKMIFESIKTALVRWTKEDRRHFSKCFLGRSIYIDSEPKLWCARIETDLTNLLEIGHLELIDSLTQISCTRNRKSVRITKENWRLASENEQSDERTLADRLIKRDGDPISFEWNKDQSIQLIAEPLVKAGKMKTAAFMRKSFYLQDHYGRIRGENEQQI